MKKIIYLLTVSFFLAGCDQPKEDIKANKSKVRIDETGLTRTVDPVLYSHGQKLYLENCAACHGIHAEGAPNWRKTDDAGKFPAPPLNGSGHTWHHSTKVLVDTIKNGTAKLGGNMPAWKDRLSDQEISAILSWIKAQWPDEIYTAWYNNFHQTK